MLYRTLGSTGEKVSAIGIGGSHLGLNAVDEPLSLRILRTAVDGGINFMDNCWDYNEGASEIRRGEAHGERDPAEVESCHTSRGPAGRAKSAQLRGHNPYRPHGTSGPGMRSS